MTDKQTPEKKIKRQTRELANKPVDITTKTAWLILIGVLILIAGLLYWGFFGSIDITARTQGILVSGGGFAYVYSSTEGTVYDIAYQMGDFIAEGDIVARVDKPDLVRDINTMQDALDESQKPELMKEHEKRLSLLKEKLREESRIITAESGKIVDQYIQKGQYVQKGETVFKISRTGETVKDLIGILYFPVEIGKTIEAGMACRLVPSTTNKEQYGFLKGTVVSVSEFPITEKAIADFTGSQKFAEIFAKEAVLEVIVDLLPSPDTPSGYQWTSSQGPSIELEPGTICEGLCITNKIRPIELIFPNLKR